MLEMDEYDHGKDEEMMSRQHIDDFTASLSTSLLGENLTDQIEQGSLSRNPSDFLKPISDRFKYLKLTYSEDSDILMRIREVEEDTYVDVIRRIAAKFGFSDAGLEEADSLRDIEQRAKAIYGFFILERVENTIRFFFNHIFSRRRKIAKEIKGDIRKKDITVSSLRKILANFDDVVILVDLDRVIDSIVDESVPTDMFIDDTILGEEDSLNNAIVLELIGDFHSEDLFKKYVVPVLDDPVSSAMFDNELRSLLITSFEKKEEK